MPNNSDPDNKELEVLRNKYLEVFKKEAPTNKYGQDPEWLRKKIKEELTARVE